MGLLYRAIWRDDTEGLSELSGSIFRDWATEKYGTAISPSDAHVELAPGISFAHSSASSDGGSITETTLVEDQGDARWKTLLRTLIDDGGNQWMWVDVERTTNDIFRRQDVAAPRMVRRLIDAGVDGGGAPRVDSTLLGTRALVPPVDRIEPDLVAGIRDPNRTLPLIVFSHDRDIDPEESMKRATVTQVTLAAVARVYVLSPSAEQAFRESLGRELSVWGGAVRIYLPGSLEPWRHRYLRREIVSRHPREAGRRMSLMLSAAIASRRAPRGYADLRRLLEGTRTQSTAELLTIAEMEVSERDRMIDELRSVIEERDERLLDLAVEIDQLNEEIDTERRRFRQLKWQIDNPRGDGDTSEINIPDHASSLPEAAALCQLHLGLVVLPDEALHDLAEMASAPEGDAWARASWRGLRALHAYAAEASTHKGGFWEWCQHSGHVDAWPATSKKLSMTESEFVMNNRALRTTRLLPVDRSVDRSGRIEMLAHLKIAEGGGDNIPRIYFHDDTKGSTGKIHVGFFGPHRLMPNSKS